MIGIEIGGWHYAAGDWAWDKPVPATVPFDLAHMGWTVVILRVLVGVLLIFAWREIMKPTLLKSLPHFFRVIDSMGLILPRKFFMPASEYKKIPSRLRDDNVMPSVSDLPQLLTSIRHPGRGRSVSIGPQSAADAYETLAYRAKRRRESVSNVDVQSSQQPHELATKDDDGHFFIPKAENENQMKPHASGFSQSTETSGAGNLPTPAQSRVGSYEQMMGQGQVLYTPAVTPNGKADGSHGDSADITMWQQTEMGETEMFSRLEKPRVRYDVEVVTKLVVYTGIAWLAVEVNPIIFEIIGLGMGEFGRTVA